MDAVRILVAEADQAVALGVERSLRLDGYDVRAVRDARSALAETTRFKPDLVILDARLSQPGLNVVRRIRDQAGVPVLVLAPRAESSPGAAAGADDYLRKPFSPRELAVHVSALMHRTGGEPDAGTYRYGDLVIDGRTRSVEDARGPLRLTAREFDLLYHLARHPGEVFTRDQLMNAVWDYAYPGDTSTVTVHMRRLRTKVERDPSRPRYLKTVWGVGYKFEP